MKRRLIVTLAAGCALFAACTPSTTASSTTPATSAASSAPSATGSPTGTSAKPSASATTATPSDPFATAVLAPDSFGPIKVGMTKQQLIDGGWGRAYEAGGQPGLFCPGAKQTDPLTERGIFFVNNAQGTLQAIGTRSSKVKTKNGATVGTSLEQLKGLYGKDLVETQSGFQAVETAYVVKGDGNTALFFFLDPASHTKVDSMYAAKQQVGGIDHGSDNC